MKTKQEVEILFHEEECDTDIDDADDDVCYVLDPYCGKMRGSYSFLFIISIKKKFIECDLFSP
jgi:hypothetical protein